MPTITVRRLDQNHDPVQGIGLAAFISDRDAVAQNIDTALSLFRGEWYQNTQAGVPLFQTFLGQAASPQARNAFTLTLQTAILGVQYVTGLTDVVQSWDSAERTYSFTCNAQTAFGAVPVSFSPVGS